jgi:hypothetical protein
LYLSDAGDAQPDIDQADSRKNVHELDAPFTFLPEICGGEAGAPNETVTRKMVCVMDEETMNKLAKPINQWRTA